MEPDTVEDRKVRTDDASLVQFSHNGGRQIFMPNWLEGLFSYLYKTVK